MNGLFLKIYVFVKSALSRDGGQSMTEYVLAVGCIALACVATETAVASSVNHTFIAIAGVISGGFPHQS